MRLPGSLTREDLHGWSLSLLIHGLIALLLLVWKLDIPAPHPEFLELSLGSIATVRSMPSAARSGNTGSPDASVKTAGQVNGAPDLPERALNTGNDVLRFPPARKLDVDEQPRPSAVGKISRPRQEKESGTGSGPRNKENAVQAGPGTQLAEVTEPGTMETMGQGSGSSVSYYMQWSDGGTRKKISGALPEYPRGVNVEAQIKIEAVVLPDGTIRSLKPSQKGNTRLEEAAMKEVRLWRFEPLKSSVPQREQACVIAFNFRLR
jgi:outer membrane biosynthesis protein TonB